jgi:hypothetical protein
MDINQDGVKFNSNIISTDLSNIKAIDWFGKLNLNAVTDLEREYVDKLLTTISLNGVQESVTFTDTRLVFVATKILINHSMSQVLLSEYGMEEYLIYSAYLTSFYDSSVDGIEDMRLFVVSMIGNMSSSQGLSVEEKQKMVSLANSLLGKVDNEDLYKRTPDFVITALQMASKMEVGEVVAPIENKDIQDAGLEDREPETKVESGEGESQVKELQDAIETFQFLIEAGASEEEAKELQEAIETFQFLIETLSASEETPPEPVKEEQEDLRDTLKKLGLTIMEQQVMEAFIKSLYAEPGFSDVDANDLSDATNITRKQIRGVLASLTKKGLIAIDTSGEYQIIYLDRDYWYLHPEWKNQLDDYAKGGTLDKKATYVPKRDIAEVEVEKNGKTKFVDGADLLDGVYVKKSKYAKGGSAGQVSYTILDDTGDEVVENADEEAIILFANTMFYYDAMDTGEEQIETLAEAMSALKSMDYSIKTSKKK